MPSAGKKRDKAARRVVLDSLTGDVQTEPVVAKTPASSHDSNDGGFDGPKTPPQTIDLSSEYGSGGMNFPSAQALVKYSRLELPPEAFAVDVPANLPPRTKFNTVGRPINVKINQYKVLDWTEKKVYQFDVNIGNGAEKRGLIRAVWGCKTLQQKLRAVDTFWLFDGNKIAWCSKKPPTTEMRITIDLDAERGRSPRMVNGVAVPNKISVRIKLAADINMAVITGYLSGKVQWNNHILAAINFLDHCIRQWPSEKYLLIKRSFFGNGQEGRKKLDNVIEGLKGVYSSIRLCPTGLALNVDVANGTFWISQPLHQSVRNFLQSTNPHLSYFVLRDQLAPVWDEDHKAWVMSKQFKELRKLIKLRFTVVHRGKTNEKKVYTIKQFAFNTNWGKYGGNARNIKFKCPDPQEPGTMREMSVEEYFDRKYKMFLDYWYLPLIQTEKDGWFPMEVCILEPNQRYQFKLTPEQTSEMIKFAVSRPEKRVSDIQGGMALLSHAEDPYLKHYGLRIEPNMTVTNARHLKNPEILFANAKANPMNNGRWDLRGKKFVVTNPVPLEHWAVAVVKNCVDDTTVLNFFKTFIQQYEGHGGVIKTRVPLIYQYHNTPNIAECVAEVRKRCKDRTKGEPQIIFYILPDKNSFEYERAKKSNEVRFGMFSQMILAAHVKKAQPQYCSNVCMKVNAKLGGATSWLTSPNIKGAKTFFGKTPTMIIGVDVSHASPGSIQPSMAAVTMSMDRQAVRYAAAVQTNGNRVEMVTSINIRSMMTKLFKHWMVAVGGGYGPSHVYYFRDGVSEGQYLHVLEQEVTEMKRLFKELDPTRDPKFTVTICSKRHHLRFFPQGQAGDKNGNPLPGTLVERDITHPFENDFYLNSHVAIQGTARPVHYHVIMDEIKVDPNDFHAMIYEQCYQYIRSTTPVSIHPAVYYAHLASNRARSHEDVASSEGPRSGKQFVEDLQDKTVEAHMHGLKPPELTITETEAKPLLNMAYQLPETHEIRKRIETGMWYI